MLVNPVSAAEKKDLHVGGLGTDPAGAAGGRLKEPDFHISCHMKILRMRKFA